MSDTKISDAAVEAAKRAMYFAANPDATEGEYIDDSNDPEAAEVEHWLRISLTAALPHLHPQPAELAEQQEVELPPLPRTHYNAYGDGSEPLYTAEQMQEYALDAIAATVKQQFGDDGMPTVCVTQEFKDQADYDSEISSAASNLLRNNTLGLSGSLPEMVAALLKIASGQQAGEVQGDERAQFEAWAKSNNYSSLKWPDGAYAEEAMQFAWKAWQHLAARQPGAQEAVAYDAGLARSRPYFECTPEQWERHTKGMTEKGQRMLANMLAHHCLLSRRDDRGWIITRFDLIRSGKPWWHVSNEGVLTYDYDPDTKARVIAAPPAQGVDLGQLPRYSKSYSEGVYRDDSGDWVKWEDVQALIYQRDEAPGV